MLSAQCSICGGYYRRPVASATKTCRRNPLECGPNRNGSCLADALAEADRGAAMRRASYAIVLASVLFIASIAVSAQGQGGATAIDAMNRTLASTIAYESR